MLSGDVHAFAAADIRDPDRPDAAPIAAKFVGGSITSLNPYPGWARDVAANPGARFADSAVRGYGLIDLTRTGADSRFRLLDDATDPASAIANLKIFRVEVGMPGMATT